MMILIHLNKNANYCDSKALLKIIWDQIMTSNSHMSLLSCLIVACNRYISCLISRRSWGRLIEVQRWRKPEKIVVHQSAIKYTEVILDGCLIDLILSCFLVFNLRSSLYVFWCKRKLPLGRVDHVPYSMVEITWLMSTASCIVPKSFGLPSTAVEVILMRDPLLA